MTSSITDTVTLNNGVKMPWLGFGVFQMKDGPETEQAVSKALEVGYRSIDTAAAYGNERSVGQAIKASSLPREELFITTKVWNADQRQGATLEAFEASRQRLGLDYIDLYLIHWPVAGHYQETWQALEKLYAEGVIRAIGVSNFHIHHLEDIFASSDVKPTVNQVEFHPYLLHQELRQFCAEQQVQFEAWSPLAQGKIFDDPTLVELNRKYGKTPAQLLIRWDLQHQVVTIPKSSTPHRIVENADVFDFEISADDMARLDSLNRNERTGPDPDDFSF
jgi:diketogulonate reductase-like aldo/keto reductase